MTVARRLVLLLPLLAACRTFGRGGPEIVSSERSDYTPVVRLQVATQAVGDSVLVDVERGSVLAVRPELMLAPPLMRDLRLTALLVATPADVGDSAGAARGAPWSVVAEGRSAPLADSLVPGESQAVAPRRWVLRRPAGAPAPRRTWIVFRITGDAMTSAVRLADGGAVPAARVPDGVRVYACAERDATGRRDRARARRQRASYGAAC
jgi:hypothetical protein